MAVSDWGVLKPYLWGLLCESGPVYLCCFSVFESSSKTTICRLSFITFGNASCLQLRKEEHGYLFFFILASAALDPFYNDRHGFEDVGCYWR